MRPGAIGPVKRLIRAADLAAVRAIVEEAAQEGEPSARPRLLAWARAEGLPA
jgi:phosphotransferase system enzyme I (PtsP)